MTSDFLARLTAAIDQAEQRARAATPAPWQAKTGYPQTVLSPNWKTDANGDYQGDDEHAWLISTTLTNNPDADAVFIAANDPATVLRNIAEDRAVLQRHPIKWIGTLALCEHGPRVYERWPCPEVLGVGRRHGITPEEPE